MMTHSFVVHSGWDSFVANVCATAADSCLAHQLAWRGSKSNPGKEAMCDLRDASVGNVLTVQLAKHLV